MNPYEDRRRAWRVGRGFSIAAVVLSLVPTAALVVLAMFPKEVPRRSDGKTFTAMAEAWVVCMTTPASIVALALALVAVVMVRRRDRDWLTWGAVVMAGVMLGFSILAVCGGMIKVLPNRTPGPLFPH